MNDTLLVNYRLQGEGEYSFDFHSHQEYEIYFFHAGSCRYLIHNQIYDLEPGDLLLMDGLTLHKPNVHPNSEYIRSVVHFSPQWIKGLLVELDSLYLIEAFQKLHHCLIRTNENGESKRLEELICRLAEVSRSSQLENLHRETEMKVLLLQVLISVHRLGQITSIKIPNQKTEKIKHAENIAAYIQHNYSEKLTLSFISEALNLSKSYVSHVFKEMTGFTVMEYVMACRLTQVKYSLEMEPDKPLHHIAFECGFESAAHFSRYFREKVGMTAKEYRRLRLENM
ncbi:helix-turn-helix transcriptional regulator [Bacillus taeanensis]|uniref:helix-turn-helix transcriptional regulator n=1 Tax=Bacillus taeanensis TaxID=273032 RepID=UPI0015F0828E|nr:helix-turn-helix domain-containing protein [Bacillus taeanensis]